MWNGLCYSFPHLTMGKGARRADRGAAYCIRNNLKENGRLLISVPVARDDLDREGRAPDGRLFIMRSFDYYTLLFERLGFKKIGYYEEGDGLGRSGVKWGVGVFCCSNFCGSDDSV